MTSNSNCTRSSLRRFAFSCTPLIDFLIGSARTSDAEAAGRSSQGRGRLGLEQP